MLFDCWLVPRMRLRGQFVLLAAQPLWLLLGAAAILCLPGPAYAFRTGRDTGDFGASQRVAWRDARATFVYSSLDSPLEESAVRSLLQTAFVTWERPRCSAIEIVLAAQSGQPPVVGDGESTIGWIAEGWDERGYDPRAAAITEVQYEGVDGQWRIAEADILINAEHHRWTTTVSTARDGIRDLLSVATHELGHALGLLHPCEDYGAGGAPDCRRADTSPAETMYPTYSPEQATLSQDSKDGVCFLYPGDGCSEDTCGDGFVCYRNDCVPGCGGRRCGQGQRCVDERCRDVPPVSETRGEIDGDSIEGCGDAGPCSWGLSCEEGICKPMLVEGDPCHAHGDCASGRCRHGHCATRCHSDDDCVSALTCSGDAAGPGWCGEDLAQFGESCGRADDCVGGRCLVEIGVPPPVCTRACGDGTAECPESWSCSDVDGVDVCVPPEESNCSFSAWPNRGRSAWLWVLAFAGCWLAIERRHASGRRLCNTGCEE